MAVSRVAKVHYVSGVGQDGRTACGRLSYMVEVVDGSRPVAFGNGRRLMSKRERRRHHANKVTCMPCRRVEGFDS
jgi:hypothetical protein